MRSEDIDQRYTSPISTDYSESSSVARFALALHFAPKNVVPRLLDLGCGNASLLEFAFRNEFELAFYYGYDLRDVILQARSDISAQWNSAFSNHLPEEEEQFDLIVALGLVSYQITNDPDGDLDEYRVLLSSALSRLSDGGRLVFTLRSKSPEEHQMLIVDPQDFSQSLGLEVVYIVKPFPSEYMIVGRKRT